MKNYVIINGTNSNTLTGLMINELPPITKPEMRTQVEEIDGRDGDIITKLGYSAYDKTITIGLFGTGYDVDNIIKFFNKEGTIVFSNEPDKYYNFTQVNGFDIERLLKFKTASITFHCQPFKYPTIETQKIIQPTILTSDGESITINNTASDSLKLSLKGNTSQASTPTPTSPIPVSVVSGDNEVKIVGVNLFEYPYTDTTKTTNGITFTDNGDGSITINGTATSDAIFYLNNNGWAYNSNYLLPTGTYTLSGSSTDTNVYIYLNAYKSDGTSQTEYTNSQTRTFITTEIRSLQMPRILVKSGATINNVVVKPQLEKGSTASTYEPYTSQTYEVDLPVENLYEGSQDFSGVWNNSSSWLDADETYNGLSVKKRFNAWNGLSKDINVEAGQTYTFSLYVKSDTSRSSAIYIAGGTATISPSSLSITTTTEWKRYSLTFTASVGGTVKPRLENTTDSSTNATYICGYQLSVGNRMNEYQPDGTTPIELCKIGTYQDYIYKDSGKWYLHKEIGKVVLNGSETTWSYGNGGWYTQDYATYIEKSTPAYSNRYTNTASTWQGNYTFSISTASFIAISDTTYPQAQRSNWITFLQNNNVIVYCVLSTPTDEEITDTNLIEQLDAIQNAMSYDGTTNISQVNNDKAFIISAKALEKGTNEVVVNNIGNVYSKPLIALEGSGNVDIYLDNTQILKANVESKMNIDIAQLEAYNPDTMSLLNRQVIGNYNSMTLQPGNNTIRIDGSLDKATISNYTRWL